MEKCPYCNGKTRYHETVQRRVIGKYGEKYYISLERRKCLECGKTFRVESDTVLPYKHYEKEIIFGVIEGLITSETLGFEDYPSFITMNRWRSQNLQVVL